jgi:hypothetical protein
MRVEDGEEQSVVRKLCEKLGLPALSSVLAKTPARLLQPILIHAWRERAQTRVPHSLLRQYESKQAFFGPADSGQRELHRFSALFYESLPLTWTGIQLAPISPLGTNSVLSAVSQDVSLATTRESEVVSDPTTALALEIARRRKTFMTDATRPNQSVHLATVQRVLRMQHFAAEKGYMQHFNLFALASGGRNHREQEFDTVSLALHVSTWLTFLKHARQNGLLLTNIAVLLSDVRLLDHLIQTVGLPRATIQRRSLDEDFFLFREFAVRLPEHITSTAELTGQLVTDYALQPFLERLRSMERFALEPLRQEFPHVSFGFDLARKAGLGYYTGPCFHIFATTTDGREVQLADGGAVDWSAKLLTSEKERLVTSGFGAELTHKLFRPPT